MKKSRETLIEENRILRGNNRKLMKIINKTHHDIFGALSAESTFVHLLTKKKL